MIQTSFNISYPLFINKHSAPSRGILKEYSFKRTDSFVKSKVNNTISFSQRQNDKKKELRRLQNEYLSLQFSRDYRAEQIFDKDGIIIKRALLAGEPINKIFDNHEHEFKYPNKVIEKFKRKIHGKPITKLLEEYRTFLLKRQELLTKIDILKGQVPPESLGPENEKMLLNYIDFIENSVKKDYDYTTSKPLRYTSKYIHFKTMVEDRIQQLNLSKNRPIDNSNKLNILVVGLGKNCEDVYDYSLYAYDALKHKNIKLPEVMNLEMVDIRPAFNFERDYMSPPAISTTVLNYDLKELVIEHPNNSERNIYTYPVPVLDFVADEMYNKKKFHPSTSIESFIQKHKGASYDFLSVNNVLEYPGYGDKDQPAEIQNIPKISRFLNPFRSTKDIGSEEFNKFRDLLRNILEMVAPGGYLSCSLDPKDTPKLQQLIISVDNQNKFEFIKDGLYRRKITTR